MTGRKETTMTVNIKWRYPDEIKPEIHEHKFYDIDPSTISMTNGFMVFGTEGFADHWNFPVDHIVEMKVRNE